MENSQIPVAVILPVYNGMKFLEVSITSVLNQSYRNFELLILDDCSADGSLDYLRSLKDRRIQLFVNERNSGLFYNLNFLIARTNAPLIKLWSQDDIMYPNCIETIVDFHNRYSQIGFSYSGRDIIDVNGKIVSLNTNDATPEIISRSLHTSIAFFTGSIAGNISNVTISKKAIENVGTFNESMKISGDFDMWVRIAEKYPVGFIRKHLIQLRNHTLQLSRQQKYYLNHLQEDVKVYRYLAGYITEAERKEGKTIMRNHKLLFYYTLMMKAFLRGSFKSGFAFLNALRRFDNIGMLSLYFLKNRVLYKNRYTKVHLDNSEFIGSNS